MQYREIEQESGQVWFFDGRSIVLCGSWLACDADTSVYQAKPVDAIAGKPAPTFGRDRLGDSIQS